MIQYAVFAEGLDDLTVADIKPAIEQAAFRAINATADRARARSADQIRDMVNFPAAYLKPAGKRLIVSRRAGPGSLEAIITGRNRPTSLARFVVGGVAGKKGATVAITKGKTVELPNAFIMEVRAGAGIDTTGNLGLAIRTKRGVRPDKAYKPVRVSDGLWLLYGPSVSQAFRFAREREMPDAVRFLEAEFNRLLEI